MWFSSCLIPIKCGHLRHLVLCIYHPCVSQQRAQMSSTSATPTTRTALIFNSFWWTKSDTRWQNTDIFSVVKCPTPAIVTHWLVEENCLQIFCSGVRLAGMKPESRGNVTAAAQIVGWWTIQTLQFCRSQSEETLVLQNGSSQSLEIAAFTNELKKLLNQSEPF